MEEKGLEDYFGDNPEFFTSLAYLLSFVEETEINTSVIILFISSFFYFLYQ